jgi:Coenzyme PQQ synthesis protein D (PqqD)
MNFFQRRNILKNVNYLDLTPVRLMEDRLTDKGKIDILLPRFKSRFWNQVYKNSKKGEFIYIHLDEIGSAIWNSIDGNLSVQSICNEMKEKHPDNLQPAEETEKRVTDFLSLLYREKYISFREILTK